MKLIKSKIKKLSSFDRNDIFKLIREVVSYNNISLEEKMFFSSTAFYYLKNSNGHFTKEAFPLKLFIPDFVIENFGLCPREQKLLIVDFLKIFLREIIFISNFVDINKSIYLYTSSLKNHRDKSSYLSCNRDLILYFSKYFKEKINIFENYPKKVLNKKQFILGKNTIHSLSTNNVNYLGSNIYSFVNRIMVSINIHFSEIENLKLFLKVNGYKNSNIIFSSTVNKNCFYKFNFIFEKDKCISVFSGNNLIG